MYCVALVVVGVVMFVLAGLGGAQRRGTSAIISGMVVGLAALGYGFYLIFAFHGGTYYISYYVFALPVLVVVRFIRAAQGPGGRNKQAKQFNQQVKTGDAARREQMAAAASAGTATAATTETAAQGDTAARDLQ